MKRSKRALSKGKIYGFNPWADQVYAINQIMEETGEKSESIVLRDLIDEALSARRRKPVKPEMTETPKPESSAEILQTIQTLLLKLIRQGEISLRIQDVSLALTQDTLAEARAGRKASWNLSLEGLKEGGLGAGEIAKRFDKETNEAKNYAYGIAEDIKKSQDVGEQKGQH
jgi:hypothetical protein